MTYAHKTGEHLKPNFKNGVLPLPISRRLRCGQKANLTEWSASR